MAVTWFVTLSCFFFVAFFFFSNSRCCSWTPTGRGEHKLKKKKSPLSRFWTSLRTDKKYLNPLSTLPRSRAQKYKESPLLEEFKTDPPPTEEVKKKKNHFQAIRERERRYFGVWQVTSERAELGRVKSVKPGRELPLMYRVWCLMSPGKVFAAGGERGLELTAPLCLHKQLPLDKHKPPPDDV